MARTWLIDGKTIAAKVKSTTQLSSSQVKMYGANRECPNCYHRIDNSDVSVGWPGLPAGVKFDPSDIELIRHLSGKLGNLQPHVFIEYFIPTIEEEEGILYTHPENLPGSKADGSNVHFFHRTFRAYATGPRKRRKILDQCSSSKEHVRWHKTGKTKAVMENGIQIGWKKIMVLYNSSKKGYKPDKSNWVMHQYHIGEKEDEEEGEFVVSKIFFQLQTSKANASKDDSCNVIVEEPVMGVRASPSTPLQHTASHYHGGRNALLDEVDEVNTYNSPALGSGLTSEAGVLTCYDQESNQVISLEDERGLPMWWEGKNQAVEKPYYVNPLSFHNGNVNSDVPANNVDTLLTNENLGLYAPAENLDVSLLHNENLNSYAPAENIDALLLCNENLNSYALSPINESCHFLEFGINRSGLAEGDVSSNYGTSDMNNFEVNCSPFSLLDLQFGSQESMGWLDRL